VKIAYLTNEYPKTSHTFIRREVFALRSQGLVVETISIRKPSQLVDAADRIEADRTRVLLDIGLLGLVRCALAHLLRHPRTFLHGLRTALRLGGRSDRGRLRHLAYLAEACYLVELSRTQNYEHLHAHFGTNPAAVAMLCRLLGGPTYSFTVHGPEEFDKPESWSLGEKIANADFVVAISYFTRSQLFRWCDSTHWNKIHVVRCGVDSLFLDSASPAIESDQLLCVGRLCEQKGQLLLVRAAAQLRNEGWPFKLVLIGDGPMRAAIESLVDQLNLREHVQLVGWKSNQEVRAMMEQSRAVVLASFAEGLPVVLMEALAAQRPVVSTYVAGIPELIARGECGWLVPAGSVSELSDSLRAALAAPREELEAMGRRGAAIVAQAHNAQLEASRLLLLFKTAGFSPKLPHDDELFCVDTPVLC
jgi:glycosyltransferase involved in cell wall biosynthesis